MWFCSISPSILPGITFQLNGTIVTGIGILLFVFAIQHTGVLQAAGTQKVVALLSLVPLVLLALVPIFTGSIGYANFKPFELKGGVDRGRLLLRDPQPRAFR